MNEAVEELVEAAHRVQFDEYDGPPTAQRYFPLPDLEHVAKAFTDWMEWNHRKPMEELGFTRIDETTTWSIKLPEIEVIWMGGTRFLYTCPAMVERNKRYGDAYPARVEVEPHPVTLGDVKFLLFRLGRKHT